MQPEVIEALYKRMKFVPELTADLFDQVLKMSLVVGLDRLDQVCREVQQAFGDQLMAVSSGFGSMDLLQAGIHKAWGLAQLMEMWQLNASQVMAFGDSGNDIEMLEMAGHSYAVANAEEAVKAVAKHLSTDSSGRWCLPGDRRVSRIDPLGTSERKELDGGTTVRRLALKGAGENCNNLSGAQSSPSERAWFDLYRRLHRGVFPPFMNYYKVPNTWSIEECEAIRRISFVSI